jgi:hypothetical protein
MPFSPLRADALVARLELDLDDGICLACLSFVSMAMDHGDPAEVTREVRRMTRDLWADGLDVQALAAVRRACDDAVADAPAALAELELCGPSSAVARSIVRRLAEELRQRARAETRSIIAARDRLLRAPPELN